MKGEEIGAKLPSAVSHVLTMMPSYLLVTAINTYINMKEICILPI
jgi:hypothetical protein